MSRMRWRNAVCSSHQTLRLQELWLVSDAAGTLGNEREAPVKSGVYRRRKAESAKRILEMVVKQEKVAA